MKILVLAGGFGTRLRNLLGNIPKPLAPVGSMPFLHYQVEHWIAQGARSFVFLLHHKAHLMVRFIEERQQTLMANCEVEIIIEPLPLDTGGAVAYAVRKLDLHGNFIITNADTWLGFGLRELCFATADTMAVVRCDDVSRYGLVDIDEDGMVLSFREKGTSRGPGWINAGMGVFQAEHFREWNGERLSLEKDVFPKLVAGKELRALTLGSDFIDIGIPEDYWRFCHWHASGCEGSLCN